MPRPLTRRTLLRLAASLPVVAAVGLGGCAAGRRVVLPEGVEADGLASVPARWVRVDFDDASLDMLTSTPFDELVTERGVLFDSRTVECRIIASLDVSPGARIRVRAA